MKTNPSYITAPWQPAGFDAEAINVSLRVYGNEGSIWQSVLEEVDKLIDKDFTLSHTGYDISINHLPLPRGFVGTADALDGDLSNGHFDIAINQPFAQHIASREGINYDEWYTYLARHELGHALGLKHPFDGTPVNGLLYLDETVMAYGYDSVGFTDLDKAALIKVNGIEDDEPVVYRFFNKDNGGHFFTTSSVEAEWLATTHYNTFSFEGAAFDAVEGDVDVYRFFNPSTGGHFFTSSVDERDFVLQQLGGAYNYEGVGYQAFSEMDKGLAGVHRFFNAELGSHFFTSDEAEARFVQQELSDVYDYEGIVFWV